MTVFGAGSSPEGSQTALETSVRRLSSGLRVASAEDDPSGLAIATALGTQAQGIDQGRRNVADATNALAVADGALATVTTLLQRMRALSVEGRSDLLSATDRASVDAEMSAMSREIGTTARAATFNGVALFDDGPAASWRSATIGRNDVLANGRPLVDDASLFVDTANGADLAFTVAVASYDPLTRTTTVRFDASSPDALQSFANTFPQSRALPTAQPSSTWWIDDATHANRLLTITLDQVSQADVGKTFSVTTGAVPPRRALAVATGEEEGKSASVSLIALSAASLGVADASIGTNDAANARTERSLDTALAQVGAMRANLGAQAVSLGCDSANAATASANLAASRSAIMDAAVGAESSTYATFSIEASMQAGLRAATRQRALREAGELLNALA